MCGKCRLEFITLADFLQHKRLCTRKRLVLLVGEDSCDELGAEPNSPFSEDFRDDPGKYDSDMPTIPYITSSPYDKPPYSPDSTGMPALISAKSCQQFTDCEDQLIDLENYAKSDTYANSEESFPNELKRSSDPISVSNSSSLPQYLLMQPVPDTNVTLQALQNTRVAVAQQGAGANNLSHLALHTALYTLQQQQIIQLHQVIQQLQSQIVGSSSSTSNSLLQNSPTVNALTGSAALTPPQSTDGNNGGVLALTTTAPSLRTLESVTQSESLTVTVTPTTTTSCSTTSSENQAAVLSSAPAPPPPPHEPNTLELLQRHTEQALQNTMAGSSFLLNGLSGIGNSSDILRFCKKGDIKKEGNEEAFFRHRCRFCGKVFGSDSALQIHIRSHTGERPFKCNVCGNRFSTKGNLKVHFARHREKYPHIKMNPHPVPLHLDNLHPPIEPPETSETPPILTSSSTCQTSAMNLQPPDLVPAQPISLITHSHEKALQSPNDIASQEGDRQSIDVAAHMHTHSLSPNEASNLSDDSDASISYGTDENGLKEGDVSRYEDDIDNDDDDDDSFSESPNVEQKDLDDNAEEDSKHMISESKGSLRIARIAPSFISSSAPTFPNIFRPSLSPSFTMAPICYPPMSTPPLTTTPTSRPMICNSGNNESNEQGRSPDPNFYQDLLPKPGSNDNSWESLMEVTKTSETSKLQQLVDNIEHKLSDPNQCVVCHRVLSCKSALQMHYRTHTGERPFRCKICSRAFTTKGNLKTHMGVHRVKPPLRVLHQCPVCHKQFTNSLVLQQHIRMHTGAPTDMHPEQIMANEVRLSHLPPTSFPRPMIPALITTYSSSPLPLRSSPTAPPINCPPKKSLDTASLASSPPTPIESVIKTTSKSKDTRILEDSSSPVTVGNSSRPPSTKPERCATPPLPVLTTEPHPGSTSTPVTTRSISPSMDKPLASTTPYSPAYTASLVALENHVKAINTTIPQPLPFSPFGIGFGIGGFLRYDDSAFIQRSQTRESNSEKSPTHSYSPSPNTSKAGSDASGDDRSTPGSIIKEEPSVSIHNPQLLSSVVTPNSDNGALDLTPKNSIISIPHSVPDIQIFPNPLASLPFPTTPGRLSTTCRICFKTFACHSALEIHYRSHTKERPFKCTVCDRGFTTKGNMKQHLLTHKSRDLQPLLFASADNSVPDAEASSSVNVTSSCTPSPIASANESNMSQGSNPNSEKKDQPPVTVSTNLITASTCTTIISGLPQLISMNANILPPKAIKTENEGNCKRPLPEHSNGSPAKKNSGMHKHFCHTCQKPFSSASALQIHNRTHSGEKPFKCVVCGRAFTTKGNLKVHMNIHLSPQNNGTSRRGRRMSLEFQTPPPLTSHGKNDFPGPTRPELYFPYFNPGYMNGIGGPAKMNEISVIQTPSSITNGNSPNTMALTPAVSMMTPVMSLGQQPPFVRKHNVDGESNEYADPRSPDEAENLKVQPSPSRPPEGSSPVRSICSSPPSGALLDKVAAWNWKTACNFCNKICSSTSDLEVHLKSHCNPTVQDTVRSLTQTAKNVAS